MKHLSLCVVVYFSDSFHKNIDLLNEQFQDQDWIGILHEAFVIVQLYILVTYLTRTLTFSGSLILYMCEVGVGSVSKILLKLTQSLYVV